MRQEVLGVERRRRWTDDEKLAVVSEVGVNGATVADVARGHDVRPAEKLLMPQMPAPRCLRVGSRGSVASPSFSMRRCLSCMLGAGRA